MDEAIERERMAATIERPKLEKIEDAKGKGIICLCASLSAILFYFFIHSQIFSESSRNSVYSNTIGVFGNLVYIIGDFLLLIFIVCGIAAVIYYLKIVFVKRQLSTTYKIKI